MANMELQIPGTKTKIPVMVLLGGGVVILLIILFTRNQEGAPFRGEELLASELDQRLKEMWESLIHYLAQTEMESGVTLPIAPPAVPIAPPGFSPAPPGLDPPSEEVDIYIPPPSTGIKPAWSYSPVIPDPPGIDPPPLYPS